MTSAQPNRRAPAPARSAWDLRRETLLMAIEGIAIRLFDERGFDAVTMEEIAATAGVSPRTMHRYFNRKADILADVERRRIHRLGRVLASLPPDGTVVDALRHALLATSTIAEQDRETVMARARVLASARSIGNWTVGAHRDAYEEIVELVAERWGLDPAADVRPRLVVTVMVSAAGVAYDHWAAGGCRDDLRALVEGALDLVAEGLPARVRAPRPRRGRPTDGPTAGPSGGPTAKRHS